MCGEWSRNPIYSMCSSDSCIHRNVGFEFYSFSISSRSLKLQPRCLFSLLKYSLVFTFYVFCNKCLIRFKTSFFEMTSRHGLDLGARPRLAAALKGQLSYFYCYKTRHVLKFASSHLSRRHYRDTCIETRANLVICIQWKASLYTTGWHSISAFVHYV